MAVKAAKHVYLCGNGGSAANAIHIANDWVACGIKAHAMTGDVATLTAIANDHGYKHVFARQVEAMGEPGDLLVALSGSGASENVVEAIVAAKAKGLHTWAIVGGYNGKGVPAAVLAENVLYFGKDMQDAEERQIYIGHGVMRWLRSS